MPKVYINIKQQKRGAEHTAPLIQIITEGLNILKKIICLAAAVVVALFSVVQACAAGIEIDTDRRAIKLNNNDESFRVEVYINNTENFAGAELGISCSDNISLESSSSTAGSMTASTKDADGMYWTSFFESTNKMPKSITVTLDFKCPKNTSSSLAVIEKVNILKKDGAGVTTERLSPKIRIAAGTSENIEEAGSTGGNSSANQNTTDGNKTSANQDTSKNNTDSGSAKAGSMAASDSTLKTGNEDYTAVALLGVMLVSIIAFAISVRRKRKK